MVNDDDDGEGERQQSFCFSRKIVSILVLENEISQFIRCLALQWIFHENGGIIYLDIVLRRNMKFPSSFPILLISCGGAWASDKYLEQFRMSFNIRNLFSRWKDSNVDKNEKRISFDIIQLKIMMKSWRE